MKDFERSMKATWAPRKKQTNFAGLSTLALSFGLVATYLAVTSAIVQAASIAPAEASLILTSTTSPASRGMSAPIQARSAHSYAALVPSALPFYKDKTVRVIVPPGVTWRFIRLLLS